MGYTIHILLGEDGNYSVISCLALKIFRGLKLGIDTLYFSNLEITISSLFSKPWSIRFYSLNLEISKP